MKKYCFWNVNNSNLDPPLENVDLKETYSTGYVIVHPDVEQLLRDQNTIVPTGENTNEDEDKTPTQESTANWTTDVMAHIAFVCQTVTHEEWDKERLYEDYSTKFGNSNEESKAKNEESKKKFDFIYDNWKSILSTFVLCKNDTAVNEALKHEIKLEFDRTVIYSMDSRSTDPGDFFNDIRKLKDPIDIRAYAVNVNGEEVAKALKASGDTNNKDSTERTLVLYTNTNKYTYAFAYSLTGQCNLRVNPSPKVRGDSDQHFLYVLCPHASAATAAVHGIYRQLLKFKSSPSMAESEQTVIASIASGATIPAHNIRQQPTNDSNQSDTNPPIGAAPVASILERSRSDDDDDTHINSKKNTQL
ncbi:unnamed protein product [Adineta ricciae]|uniref:Uncharacterized protein n=2 Tax=Adineta ricciae TaxID=249248 RepID=A0A815GQK2_ADIRI|nr:unnamed protein product [Adineta ricciae]